MQRWQELEVAYAKRLRASSRDGRRELYAEAYRAVSEAGELEMPRDPEQRTAGTSPTVASLVIRLCKAPERVLEVGCGRGYTCMKVAPHVRSMVGIDISEPALREARELLEKSGIDNVTLIQAGADDLAQRFGEGTFDKAVSIDVYEHLHPEDAAAHLAQVHALLKPRGKYLIITPNRLTGPHDITRKVFPGAMEPLGFHLNETTGGELIANLRRAGFVTFRSVLPLSFKLGIPFDLLYPSLPYVCLEQLYRRMPILRGLLAKSGLLGRIVLVAQRG